jgi:pepsin A
LFSLSVETRILCVLDIADLLPERGYALWLCSIYVKNSYLKQVIKIETRNILYTTSTNNQHLWSKMRVLFLFPFALGLGCAATRTKDERSSKPLLTIPVVFAEGFWFGNLTAGDAADLSLLIDTGSSDVYVNPDLYKPSSESHTLNQTVSMSFITTKPDGCGEMILKSNVVADRLAVGSLTVTNQSMGTVIKVPQPNPDTITQFPGQGIIGLLGTSADDSSVGDTPFFQHLCNEGRVDECRFGLGLETSGTGSLTLGGVDHALVSGDMATAPISGQQWIIEGGLPSDVLDVGVQQSMFLDSGTSNVSVSFTLPLFEG